MSQYLQFVAATAIAGAVLAILVIYKRSLYRPKKGRAPWLTLVVAGLLFFLPASIAWFFFISLLGWIVPLPFAGIIILIGFFVLAKMLLGNEFVALRRST
ncbi:MAG: hypothetical protein WBQ69_07105 [Gallionella sp.]